MNLLAYHENVTVSVVDHCCIVYAVAAIIDSIMHQIVADQRNGGRHRLL
jgi:hypothetical protein